jgi:hypothetical protein
MNLSKTIHWLSVAMLLPLALSGCLEPDGGNAPRRVYGSRYPTVRQNGNSVEAPKAATPGLPPATGALPPRDIQLPAVGADTITGSNDNQAPLRSASDAMTRGDWAAAVQFFDKACFPRCEQAEQAKAEFARLMLAGTNLTAQDSFGAAANAYSQAIALGTDLTAVAKDRRDAVMIRPYDIRVSELIINGADPNGKPWVKPKDNTGIALFAGFAADYLTGGAISFLTAQQAVKSYADRLPPELTPNVYVEFQLPDGQKFPTDAVKSLASAPAESLTLSANHFIQQSVTITVFVQKKPVATQTVPIGELLKSGAATFSAAGTSDEITDMKRPVIFMKVEASLSGSATSGTAAPALPLAQFPPGQTF